MKTKTVELVASPRSPHFVRDGFRVHNFIPSGFIMDMQRMDPFFLLDYNSKYTFPPSDKPPIHMFNAKLKKGGKAAFQFPAQYYTVFF